MGVVAHNTACMHTHRAANGGDRGSVASIIRWLAEACAPQRPPACHRHHSHTAWHFPVPCCCTPPDSHTRLLWGSGQLCPPHILRPRRLCYLYPLLTPHRIGRAPSSASARKSPGPRSACTHLWCSVHCPPPRAPPRADDRGRSTTRLEGASAGPTAERNKMHAAGGANDAATRRPVAAVYARTCFAPPAITPASPPAAVR